jgi:hypothetical protein
MIEIRAKEVQKSLWFKFLSLIPFISLSRLYRVTGLVWSDEIPSLLNYEGEEIWRGVESKSWQSYDVVFRSARSVVKLDMLIDPDMEDHSEIIDKKLRLSTGDTKRKLEDKNLRVQHLFDLLKVALIDEKTLKLNIDELDQNVAGQKYDEQERLYLGGSYIEGKSSMHPDLKRWKVTVEFETRGSISPSDILKAFGVSHY